MKFGKRLQSQLDETIPEWRDKYLSYKHLKKRLKLISVPNAFTRSTEPRLSSPRHERPGSLSNSVEVTSAQDVQRIKQWQGDQYDSLNVVAERTTDDDAAACVAESQDRSLYETVSITEDFARSSSSASNGVTVQEFGFSKFTKNLTAEELDFWHLLNAELEKLNSFFIEKEEEYVIRLQELKDRIEKANEVSGPTGSAPSESDLNEEMMSIRKEFVKFHGEMVLLENYSSLNYTGLVKILKKHDKHTGALLRMPFIQNVLHQPFFTTELLSKLVHECEANLQSLFSSSSSPVTAVAATFEQVTSVPFPDIATPTISGQLQHGSAALKDGLGTQGQQPSFFHGDDVESIYKSTMAALRTMRELRRGSSTYNAFSLPPFGCSDTEEGYVIADGKKTAPWCAADFPICAKSWPPILGSKNQLQRQLSL